MGIEAMEFFWEQYLQDENLKNDPRAVPLLADIKELPAMTLITPGLDPLQDDSFDLIKKLNYGSIKYQHFHYPGVVHGFVSMCHTIDDGDKAISDLAPSTTVVPSFTGVVHLTLMVLTLAGASGLITIEVISVPGLAES